jgi:hypothetical protein
MPEDEGSVFSNFFFALGFIGGTFISKAGPEFPPQEEFEILIASARDFYGL